MAMSSSFLLSLTPSPPSLPSHRGVQPRFSFVPVLVPAAAAVVHLWWWFLYATCGVPRLFYGAVCIPFTPYYRVERTNERERERDIDGKKILESLHHVYFLWSSALACGEYTTLLTFPLLFFLLKGFHSFLTSSVCVC
eukprot:scpid93901/ scgid20248/ 